MAIDKADILTFVNNRLQESFSDIDDEIKATLADLSKYNLLATAVQAIYPSGTQTIPYPSLYKKLVSMTPFVGTGSDVVRKRPLLPLPGGYKEYQLLLVGATGNFVAGQMYYAEFRKLFFIYPTLTQTFTFLTDYYKNHANTADTIEFGDEFINAINYGATYHAALFRKKTSYIDIWLPIYVAERATMIAMNPPEPSILR